MKGLFPFCAAIVLASAAPCHAAFGCAGLLSLGSPPGAGILSLCGSHRRIPVPIPRRAARLGRTMLSAGPRGAKDESTNPQELRERAFRAAREGDPALAVALFAQYLSLPQAATDAAAMNADGAMKARLGQLEDALATFQRALAVRSGRWQGHL